ncbi:aTP-dependent helicase/nuclease subunit A [Clostridium sp. CAG:524]|nr:aTP-dependent helicase/nuclease subunit A [Clostridium sp. CAG:524]
MPRWTKEQEEAIYTSGKNIIVSAGAGSGKTAVLSERVLHKIEEGTHVNELLILTFTRAAADEMKDRIRKKISGKEELKKELTLLNSSYITTFDSFALSVVKKYHYLLNITDNINITDESIVKIQNKKILDLIFERSYKNIRFQELIKKYCIKTDKVLKENILSIALKIDGFIDPFGFIDNVYNNFFNENNVDNLLKTYESIINDLKKTIELEIENMSLYFDSDYIEKVNDAVYNILNADIDELHLYSTVKLPTVPRGSSEEAKASKDSLKKACDKLLSYGNYGTINDIKNDIYSTKDTVLTILDIIKEFLLEIEKYKKENDIYTFNDISKLSIKILKENENIREELKSSFKEIMIDEYQDTNDVQETFIGMISNNNVYMVGDIKQSIYRFRGSNPEIFKEKYSNYSKDIGGYKIDLIKNFRSRSEVLDNINKIFCLIMDYNLGSAEYSVSHQMVYGNTAYDTEKVNGFNYNFRVLEYLNKQKESGFSDIEVEIFTIAKDIKNKLDNNFQVFDKEDGKLRNATYNDFVIILDRSKYFDDFKKIFEYFDIPLTILKDGKLNSTTDILLIKNLVDFIIKIKEDVYDIDFKYDFISIARSFLYEYSDEYIFDIVTNNKIKETTIYNDLSTLSDKLNSYTSSLLFNDILDVTDFYNKLNKVGDYEEVNVRLKTINSLSSSLSSLGLSIMDFRDYLTDIIENDEDIKYATYTKEGNSVKILTIHKSKGLEYPICYFADLDHEFNTSELKDKFIVDKKYGLIVPSNLEEIDNSLLKEMYKYDFNREEVSEKIRLFYVALTRAREQMIIVLPDRETRTLEKNNDGVIEEIRRLSFNKLSSFIYGIKNYLYSYFEQIDIEKLGLTKNYLYPKKIVQETLNNIKDNINVEEINIENEVVEEKHFSKETNKIITKEENDLMKFGTKVHEIFELLDFRNIDLSLVDNKFIRNKVEKFLSNDLLKNISNANIYKEYEFIYNKDNNEYHGIIDLMLEYDNHIDIIDYKLKGITDENYIKQLNGYKEYIEKISNKEVSTYLYSILDEKVLKIN